MCLPKETRNYVPIILAVTIMAKNPAQYGLDDIVPEQPVPYDAVKIDYSVDLRLVAQCIDVSPATLQDLNPSLLRLTTPKDQTFELRLPAGTRDRYLAAIEPIPTADAGVVAISRSGGRRHAGLDCAHLSHQCAGHRKGKPSCGRR